FGTRRQRQMCIRDRPRPTAPPPTRAVTPPSSEDLRAATSDPMVREALDLFDGTLVHVERLKGPGA
ncbi:MAG: hypothetical protein QUV05_20335, partial [Phycisphaerae bacterium]|nr:hypothetical protein [Phycisphaerae bacterium]